MLGFLSLSLVGCRDSNSWDPSRYYKEDLSGLELIDFNILEINDIPAIKNDSDMYECRESDKVLMEFKIRNERRWEACIVGYRYNDENVIQGILPGNEEWISCETIDTDDYPITIVTVKNMYSIFGHYNKDIKEFAT